VEYELFTMFVQFVPSVVSQDVGSVTVRRAGRGEKQTNARTGERRSLTAIIFASAFADKSFTGKTY
ncbi:hypothetical protein ACIAIL_14225, partial [Raoultella ornithinolytica]|uniref:hypothetical protein n=1 Tax=Raoultella ornithinolytica TaxID=54291 RepID=UPI003D6FE9CF